MAVLVFLLPLIAPSVLAWISVERGVYQPFNIEEVPLEIRIRSGRPGIVTLDFVTDPEDETGSPKSIVWRTESNIWEITNCSEHDRSDLASVTAEQLPDERWIIHKTREKLEILGGGSVVSWFDSEVVSGTCWETWWGSSRPGRYMRISPADQLTIEYRVVRDGMCPRTHPYVYNQGSDCCADSTREEEEGYRELACVAELSRFTRESKTISCKDPPCSGYLYQEVMDCIDGRYDPNGVRYRGEVGVTQGGLSCIPWSSSSSSSSFGYTSEDEDLGITPGSAYCRNPSNIEKPWCYTEDTEGTGWDYCDIPYCNEEEIAIVAGDNNENEGDYNENEGDYNENEGDFNENEELEEEKPRTIALYNPTMSHSSPHSNFHSPSQYLHGYFGPTNAVDGDYTTFAYSDETPSIFEAWFSPAGKRGWEYYEVEKIIVYTHIAFTPPFYASSYYTTGLEVALENTKTGVTYVCVGPPTYTPYQEMYPYYCESGMLFNKMQVYNIAYQNSKSYAIVIREVQVYGELQIEPRLRDGVKVDSPDSPDSGNLLEVELDTSTGKYQVKKISIARNEL